MAKEKERDCLPSEMKESQPLEEELGGGGGGEGGRERANVIEANGLKYMYYMIRQTNY